MRVSLGEGCLEGNFVAYQLQEGLYYQRYRQRRLSLPSGLLDVIHFTRRECEGSLQIALERIPIVRLPALGEAVESAFGESRVVQDQLCLAAVGLKGELDH